MRVYFHTFGCKANQYDTELVRQALEHAGAIAVADPETADVAIVNSCTVTHTGEAKMRGLVRRLRRGQPGIRTLVMGCAAALDNGTIAALPGVSDVIGGSDPRQIMAALGTSTTDVDPVLRRFTRGVRAWVKIQDGCDEHCTFCATTLARGANRSRAPEEVVREAQALALQHDELVLTGVHIGTYGRDLDGWSLGRLTEELIRHVPDVRFRLSSVEATEVDERLEDLMVSAPERLAPHLHAPLQSGSDAVLKRMGRHWYTARTYRERCETLAERLPIFGLGADVIVGFPGESADDHRATRRLIEALPFTYLHVFPYSERPDAVARRLGPPVDPNEAAARSAELRELADQTGRRYAERRTGQNADVVLLGRRRGKSWGVTEDYLDVYLPTTSNPPSRFRARLGTVRNGGLKVETILDGERCDASI